MFLIGLCVNLTPSPLSVNRRHFLQNTALLSGCLYTGTVWAATSPTFKTVRPALAARKFSSRAIEKAIAEFKSRVKDPELGWLFENCFPNTLDTTVSYAEAGGQPDTYVITGDIDAMWLRDSSAQVWPYLPFCRQDAALRRLVAGVIRRQARCVNKDPYANAFYGDDTKTGEWKNDLTDMKPGLHERKWEIDSLCYPIRLAHGYWQVTGDPAPFDDAWEKALTATLRTFREQQRKTSPGPYHFQRSTAFATDGVPLNGYGYPVKPVGLICSSFRPSDDATVFSFLIPSNFFAVVSLRQAADMLTALRPASGQATAADMRALAAEVEGALKQYATTEHPTYGRIYAYEVNGLGSINLMDDANVPSLLSLPYLGAVPAQDPVYQNTRRFLLSPENPFFFQGKAAEGIGGPHAGLDMIWPLGIIIRGLTSADEAEIRACVQTLRRSHAGTGYMHESFHKDDFGKFSRPWFAWANTLFGEFLWKTYKENPRLLV